MSGSLREGTARSPAELLEHTRKRKADAQSFVDRAVGFLEKNDLPPAAVLLEQALTLDAASAFAHYNMALVAERAGHAAESVHHYKEAVRLSPGLKTAWQNLAGLLHQNGFWHEAQLCFRRARGTIGGHLGLGRLLLDQGRVHEALEEFRTALAFDSTNTDSLEGCAVALLQLGQVDEGISHYNQAIEKSEPSARTRLWADLSEYLERSNRTEEARRTANNALDLNMDQTNAHLTLARLDMRAHPEMAVARLRPRIQSIDDDHLRARALFVLAHALDRSPEEQAEEAFICFSRANRVAEPLQSGRSAYDEETLDAISSWSSTVSYPRLDTVKARPMVFLVGFPRSGTTLMQTMLAGHPAVRVLEEKPTLAPLLERFVLPELNLDHLNDSAETEQQRILYWRAVNAYLMEPEGWAAENSDTIIIDKQPMASAQLPILARLFPEAQFIFAQRDPRDVCLSCFMQDFRRNPVMEHFRSLKEAAQYYKQVMTLFLSVMHAPSMQGRMHTLRYEDLLKSPEKTLGSALNFLGLEWHEDVLDYRKQALSKVTTTPSYAQITAPLNKRGVDRWLRYKEFVAGDFDALRELVHALGYDVAPSRLSVA